MIDTRPAIGPVQLFARGLALGVLAIALVAGCGGLPSENAPEEPVGSVVVIVVEAGTGNPLQVPATVIVGGVRGVLNPQDEQLVLRNVPVGTGTPPTQPLTVSAPGYVTHSEAAQVNVTTATWLQVELTPADTSVTGTAQGIVTAFDTGEPVVNAFVQFFLEGSPEADPVAGFTDNEGRFVIGGIPMGANTLSVQASGFLEHTERVVIIADADGNTPDTEIRLISGDTRIEVRGQVLDVLTRLPVEGASVTIGDQDPVLTDADGRFAVPDVLVGDHDMEVTHPDYDPYRVTLTVMPGTVDLLIELFERAAR
ncbi:MAG: carboxypeptidase regulatory-like domain-containing protein, partial [Armatimonadetes bacterium]|nr:carboxypeptidase regulatory-like domain-containing protein [Armatimonadota bacterium]